MARGSRSAQRGLAVLLACAALLACSGGVGTFTTSKNVAHETPGEHETDPPTPGTPEARPETREGTQCLPCTGAYRCTGAQDSELQGENLALSVRGSGCEAKMGVSSYTFACGGTVAVPGRSTIGTWKDVGGGVLSVCFGTANVCVQCSPLPRSGNDAPPGEGTTSVDAGGRG